VENCFPPKPFGIAVKKGNPALLAALNASLVEEARNGTLENLFAALRLPKSNKAMADQTCKQTQ
jgi:ABC-type amino acid transport substrate-binding protein